MVLLKVLLVRPDFFTDDFSTKVKKFIYRNSIHGGVLPPLGLCSIAATLEENAFDVSILDLWAEPMSERQFESYIHKVKPDIVGMYVTTIDVSVAVFVAKKIKCIDPSIFIVVGGPNLGAYPKETLFHKCFDFGLIGESDFSMPLLAQKIASGSSIQKVPGIVFRRGKKVCLGKPDEPVRNLDVLPFPSRHLLNGKYSYVFVSREPFTPMVASRGCPFQCAFCDKPPGSSFYRERSIGKVVEEFALVEEQGYGEVILFDDTFTLNKKRVLAICDGIVSQGIDLDWSIRSRTDTVDRKMLSSLKKAGCKRLYYGVESGSDEILKLMGKRTNIRQIEEAFRLSNSLGFETIAYFIFGFPGETPQTMQASINLAKKIKPSFVSIASFLPLPQSRIYKDLLAVGMQDSWIDFIRLETKKMPSYFGKLDKAVVFEYYQKAFKELYLDPKSIFRVLGLINNATRMKNFSKAAACLAFEKLLWGSGSWDV